VGRKKAGPLGSILPLPLQFLAAWLAVWFARALQRQVDYLMAENKILKERLGDRKLQLTNADRRRLAILGEELGLKVLGRIATIAAAETILRWYRELVAALIDGISQDTDGLGPVARRERLGGLLNFYSREAA
jgi:hypothetical protein